MMPCKEYNMKARFVYPIDTLSGKVRETGRHLFRLSKDNLRSYLCSWTMPTITQHNHDMGLKFNKVVALYALVSTGFKQALDQYANAYNNQHKAKGKDNISGYNVFIMALMNNIVDVGDLNSLSDVVTAHGATLSSWVAAGLLRPVDRAVSTASIN